jgi:hypothetical protein
MTISKKIKIKEQMKFEITYEYKTARLQIEDIIKVVKLEGKTNMTTLQIEEFFRVESWGRFLKLFEDEEFRLEWVRPYKSWDKDSLHFCIEGNRVGLKPEMHVKTKLEELCKKILQCNRDESWDGMLNYCIDQVDKDNLQFQLPYRNNNMQSFCKELEKKLQERFQDKLGDFFVSHMGDSDIFVIQRLLVLH